MTHDQIIAHRRLWQAVITTALNEHRLRIKRASRARKTRTETVNGQPMAIQTLEAEIAAAREYMTSRDFRDLCELAGVSTNVEAAMNWVSQTRRSGKTHAVAK